MVKRALSAVFLAACVCVLSGCGSPYTLRGKAIDGGYGSIAFVEADDAQLGEPGVAGARIAVYRDGDRPNQALFATGRTDGRGGISIPLEGFGVGWMEEQWLIEVTRQGYETVRSVVTLPSAKRDLRLLITLTPGLSTPGEKGEDLWEEYKRYR
ncbi:MAG: hypothetical protein SYC29_06735 [Planctomycetota bacterium]|nr:hypothetical protein [Planctomycetota bacterium]